MFGQKNKIQLKLAIGEAFMSVSNLIHQQYVSTNHRTDLHPGGLDVAFVSHSETAVELHVALSVEVVGLQSANNENKPLQ